MNIDMLVARSDQPSAPTICGLDEAGRGALAGPLVVAGVCLPAGIEIPDDGSDVVWRDSKLLTVRQRTRLGKAIVSQALEIALCVVSVDDINRHGINWANTDAFAALIRAMRADAYIVDGVWKLPDLADRAPYVRCVVGADRVIPSVLAAGVIAKLSRDRIMAELDELHPPYGWATNTGHGTEAHIPVIRSFGSTELHRTQFVDTALDGRKAALRRAARRRKVFVGPPGGRSASLGSQVSGALGSQGAPLGLQEQGHEPGKLFGGGSQDVPGSPLTSVARRLVDIRSALAGPCPVAASRAIAGCPAAACRRCRRDLARPGRSAAHRPL
jgi:ribonuclease HII